MEKCFSNVQMSRINQVVGGERQKYTLELDLKCPEDNKDTKKKKTETGGAGSAASSATTGGK